MYEEFIQGIRRHMEFLDNVVDVLRGLPLEPIRERTALETHRNGRADKKSKNKC